MKINDIKAELSDIEGRVQEMRNAAYIVGQLCQDLQRQSTGYSDSAVVKKSDIELIACKMQDLKDTADTILF